MPDRKPADVNNFTAWTARPCDQSTLALIAQNFAAKDLIVAIATPTAQAIAQVCEVTWQLRGQAGARQVEGAKVGITANQGLFGHGSSVIVKR